MEEKFESLKADIPLPIEVYTLEKLFSQNKKSLFAVGGAVRDYLYFIHHGGEKYEPKDIDLATEATPDKILAILQSSQALIKGVKTFPKGEAFGVISAVINGREMEIATFREDGKYTDGRRPDSVNFSTPGKDAQRRDIYINALFYEINKKEIRDYNLNDKGQGQGLLDIKNLVARPVGKAHDRFQEDKLRIPRLIRFFSRFNPGYVVQHLDKEVLEAIEEFKDLAGVSPERIATEFIGGLQKALAPVNYLINYQATGLMPFVFPNMQVDMRDVNRIGNIRNPHAVLAWLFKNENATNARIKLNKLKYSNEIADAVAFLINLYQFDISRIAQLLKYRDLHKQLESPESQMAGKDAMTKDVLDFAKIAGKELELQKFLNYQQIANSQNYPNLKGKELGSALKSAEINAYKKYQA